jgi:hypothetical protein
MIPDYELMTVRSFIAALIACGLFTGYPSSAAYARGGRARRQWRAGLHVGIGWVLHAQQAFILT